MCKDCRVHSATTLPCAKKFEMGEFFVNCSNLNSLLPLILLLCLLGCFGNQSNSNGCCCGDAGLFNAGGGGCC